MDERISTNSPRPTARGRRFVLEEDGLLHAEAEDGPQDANAEGVWQTEAFHRLFYGNPTRTWLNTLWMGHEVLKNPFDLWVMQEIIHRVQPDVLIETGTHRGGSALFFANLFDVIGKGHVFSIDISPEGPTWPLHSRISYLHGSSTDTRILQTLRDALTVYDTVMVDLDSDHRTEHVLAEMRLYAPLVTKDSYLIVEDTNLSGHPVQALGWAGLDLDLGPWEAVRRFLEDHPEFVPDKSAEKFYLTFNPGGYLTRVA